MYRPPAYAIDDIPVLHSVMRERAFTTIAGIVDARIHFAYAPVVVDAQTGERGAVRYHIARNNPIARLDGARVHLSFLGPDAYVSPDWYANAGFVPTWNYIAVEGEGVMRCLNGEELRLLLDDLSRGQEEALRPKPLWTMEKLSADRTAMLMNAIYGFEIVFETLQGKFKLSQDKSSEDRQGVIAALEMRGDPASLAVAAAMRAEFDVTAP